MKQAKVTRFITIKEANPDVFDTKVNDFLSKDYEIIEKKWHDQNGELSITFEYYDKVWQAKDLKEQYELMGNPCYCGECTKLELNPDGRVKYHLCTKTGESKRVNSLACNWYYCFLEGRRDDVQANT